MSRLERHLCFRMEEYFEDGHQLRLALVGELDVAVVRQLADRLSELRKGGYLVRLDLSRLAFIDSSGLREILTEIATSRRDGWQLEVGRELTDPVARVIDLVGARSYFWPDQA
ncbi:MAG TPA: STAS domain-containing protein [Solirubrobacteraceae bacterium]|nr:STAS domain-containing protein [Solirubrobacteraceae bacterium]